MARKLNECPKERKKLPTMQRRERKRGETRSSEAKFSFKNATKKRGSKANRERKNTYFFFIIQLVVYSNN